MAEWHASLITLAAGIWGTIFRDNRALTAIALILLVLRLVVIFGAPGLT